MRIILHDKERKREGKKRNSTFASNVVAVKYHWRPFLDGSLFWTAYSRVDCDTSPPRAESDLSGHTVALDSTSTASIRACCSLSRTPSDCHHILHGSHSLADKSFFIPGLTVKIFFLHHRKGEKKLFFFLPHSEPETPREYHQGSLAPRRSAQCIL